MLGRHEVISLGPNYKDVFDKMRAKLRSLLHTTVHKCVHAKEIPSLEELKTFLGIRFQEIQYDMKHYVKSFDDLVDTLMNRKCTILNLGCLEIIADHYNIEEAKAQIAAYKLEVDRLCEELKIKICEDFMTGPSSLLKYETINFYLTWRPDSSVLNDIKELLWKAFEDIATKINVTPQTHKGNIMIVVSIVHMYLSGRQ